MEADWREARKVKSSVQTQVIPREVCDEHNGIGTQWRAEGGGFGGSNPPSPREIPKDLQNRAKLNSIVKDVKIAEFRTPTPQDVWKKGSKILKLPPVRKCFTLAMTNKLVVIINSLKLPKIKKILLY